MMGMHDVIVTSLKDLHVNPFEPFRGSTKQTNCCGRRALYREHIDTKAIINWR